MILYILHSLWDVDIFQINLIKKKNIKFSCAMFIISESFGSNYISYVNTLSLFSCICEIQFTYNIFCRCNNPPKSLLHIIIFIRFTHKKVYIYLYAGQVSLYNFPYSELDVHIYNILCNITTDD